MADYQLLINGELCDAASGETFETYNPGKTEKTLIDPRAEVSQM